MSWRSRRCMATAALIAAGLASPPAKTAAQSPMTNPGFEQGQAGSVPEGWLAPPRSQGFDVELVEDVAHGGRRAARISSRADAPPSRFGNIMQFVDATPFRGKRIRLRGYVRTETFGPMGAAALWLRVDRPGGAPGFFDNMGDRPIRSPEWRPFVIVGQVAADAQQIYFGMMLHGSGRAWLDDVTLDTLPPAPAPEPARALTERGLANEVAFARLLGYVRFFHPSDEAAATDWNAFAIRGARAVESAADPRALAATLDSLFRPVAPSLQLRAGPPGSPARTLAAPPTASTVVAWRHLGVGLSGSSVYHSERVRAAVVAGALPDSIADPREPLRVDLGGGVSAAIPLAVFADGAGTLPRGARPASEEEPLPASAYTGDDRATRLADVALAWTIMQHFYPYFDVAGTDWAAELPKALRSAAADSDAGAFETTLRRMIAALRDGHGGARLAARGRVSPAVLVGEAEGKVVVLAVAPGEQRLRPGDVLTTVDGRPVAEALAHIEELTSAATPQWRRFRALGELLTGPRGTTVTVGAVHPDGTHATVALPRTGAAPAEQRPAPIAEVRPGIWYVDMDRVTTKQFEDSLPRLERARGLVFDMRGYPSALQTPVVLARMSHSLMTSAQWHIPVVTRPDRADMRFQRGGEWQLMPLQPYLAAPRAFIVDGRAVSYAESTMGIVEHYKLGAIVGEPTAGTNGNVNPFQLPGGYSITWTGMKVLKQDGSRHHGVGILPTVPAHRTVAGIAAGRDELLEKAIEAVTR